MKTISLLSFFVILTPLVAQNESAPAAVEAAVESQAKTETASLLPHQQAFLNLPEERRKEFIDLLTEANRVFAQKRVFETLEKIDKAAGIFQDSPELHNLRGSCFTEMRAFDKAMAEFKKAQALMGNDASIGFNIGEIYFVTKQWQQAHDAFTTVLKLLPPENIAFTRLVEFKILLCMKKLGMDNEVTILAEKYDFLDDSPFHYYAQAVLAYDKEDLVTAEEWLARAGRIFQDPNVIAPWQDTMVEYGYIKSFYGDDAAAE